MTDTTSTRADAVNDTAAASNPDLAETATDSPAPAAGQGDDWQPSPLFATPAVIPVTPEASPDGRWLAYLLERGDDPTELWLSPTDGGEPQRVDLPFAPLVERDPDTGRLLRGPQWSPDGRTIALAGSVEGEERTAIWLVPSPVESTASAVVVAATGDTSEDGETAGATPEATVDAGEDGGGARDTAAAAGATSGGEAAADTTPTEPVAEAAVNETQPAPEATSESGVSLRAPRLLTWGPGSERSPRWSLDGQVIAFVSHRGGRDVIALATTTGDEPTIAELLTWSDRDDRELVWSRDGRFLAFTRKRSDGPEHADIFVYSPENGELTDLTGSKASAIRHSLEWVPGRNLVAYVTEENDWLSVSVINADNKAGWAVTRESGDKTEPRFHPTEARLVYVRSEGFTTVCCERGLHASGAVALDPSEGVVYAPRWLMDKRVVYGFSAPQKPFGFLAQDNLANAERTELKSPQPVTLAGTKLRHPVPFEFAIGDDEQFSGMLYRSDGTVGPAPALVYLPDGPLHTRRGEFQLEEQALASSGITVLAPVLHGATGFGKGVEQDLAALVGSELEISDIAEAGYALGEANDVDAGKLALVGVGYGGALALLTAGARPGIYAAVVAIDPITDWSIELGEADVAWRTWVSRNYGMPLTHPDAYALRTPATFAAVLDVPVILIGRARAAVHRQAQLELFEAYLDANGIAYEHIDAGEESLAATLERAGRTLARLFQAGHDTIELVDDIRADALG